MEAYKHPVGQAQPAQSGHSISSFGTTDGQHYRKLAIMTGLLFVSMYMLMYSMVDWFANVIPSVNQVSMAGLMPMVIIEVLLMSSMYMNKRRNRFILAGSVLALIGFFLLTRQQGFVGDRQFAKSVIPHRTAAILMVKEAKLTDPDLRNSAGHSQRSGEGNKANEG